MRTRIFTSLMSSISTLKVTTSRLFSFLKKSQCPICRHLRQGNTLQPITSPNLLGWRQHYFLSVPISSWLLVELPPGHYSVIQESLSSEEPLPPQYIHSLEK